MDFKTELQYRAALERAAKMKPGATPTPSEVAIRAYYEEDRPDSNKTITNPETLQRIFG